MRAGVTCACATAAVAAAVAQSARADAPLLLRPLGAHGPLGNERLSDERRLTRSAVGDPQRRTARGPTSEILKP